MSRVQVAEQRVIAAPAEQIYHYIADYRQHHPRFLPPAFSNFTVEQGGYGAGTIYSFDLKVGNRSQHFRQQVEEPAPRRVLLERTLDVPQTTTFVIQLEGTRTLVRIETVRTTGGLRGIVERLLVPRILQHLYRQELEMLDQYAAAP